ncbi:MAG: VOC family protein [Oligoflexia bacterium]|nr:VOC family protein [Oligoflexia bacterium]
MTKAVPEQYHAVTPNFTFRNSKQSLEFYKRAFGGEVIEEMPSLDGRGLMRATMQIGDSVIMRGDEMPSAECRKSAESMGSSPISLYLYVSDADAVFAQAVAAGAQVTMPLADMFWGDRVGQVKDPFGYLWMIATHKQDLTPEQVQRGAVKFFAGGKQ